MKENNFFSKLARNYERASVPMSESCVLEAVRDREVFGGPEKRLGARLRSSGIRWLEKR